MSKYVDLTPAEHALILALRLELESHSPKPRVYSATLRISHNVAEVRIDPGLASKADGDTGATERIALGTRK